MRGTVAILTGSGIAGAVACLLAFNASGLQPSSAWIAIAAGLVAAVLAFLHTPKMQMRKPGVWGWMAITAFALFAFRAFFWLIWEEGEDVRFLSPNNFGDISLHLTYIRLFANGARFWPDNPIFTGTPLHYPLGVDVLNSLLVLAGMDVYRGLIWVGVIASILTCITLFAWGRSFTIAGFLFNGGFAALPFLTDFGFADYQEKLAWKSIPLAIFVTQRGMLWAIPAGLALLCSWRARFFQDTRLGPNWRLPFWVEVVLYGTMPFFHFHTFLFLSLLLGAWLIFGNSPLRIGAAKLVGAAIIPGSAFTMLVTGLLIPGQVKPPSSFLGIVDAQPQNLIEKIEFGANNWLAHHGLPLWVKIGWLQRGEPFWEFWWSNFGIFPLLVLTLILALILRRVLRNGAAPWFVSPSVFVLILTLVVMFARWEWDNTKLMIWGYMALLPFLWELLLARWPVVVRVPVCLALFFSGAICLVGGLSEQISGFTLTRRADLASTEQLLKDLPIKEPILGYPTYNHTILLSGHKMPMGFDGHLWSHGIDYRERKAKIESLLRGEGDWQNTARELGVRYLFWGPMERANYPGSTQPWRLSVRLLKMNDGGELYDLRTPWQPVSGGD